MEDLKIWVGLLWIVITISFGKLAYYHYKLSKKRLPQEIVTDSNDLDVKTSAETKSFFSQFNKLNKNNSLAQMGANIISCMASFASFLITLFFM